MFHFCQFHKKMLQFLQYRNLDTVPGQSGSSHWREELGVWGGSAS
jgi:hypothetical protein